LDVAVEAAKRLEKPPSYSLRRYLFIRTYPHANLRHYRFLGEGIPDIA
jgi:hypothetical protein